MRTKKPLRRPRAVLFALVLGLAGCGDRGTPDLGRRTDTLERHTATAGAPRQVAEIRDLAGPEAVRYDPELDVWFVATFGGDTLSPLARDNNGSIGRFRPDGTADSLRFVAGGRGGAALNAPKGMALTGDTLWVADIDVVRAFDKRTGAPLASVPVPGARFLNDVAVGPDGIYVTDTGIGADSTGRMSHSGPDRIFRVGPGRRVTVALQHDSLAGPNGIVWDSAGRSFLVVPFFGKTIVRWAPGDSAPSPVTAGPGQQDGIEPIGGGRFVVSAWADSSLFVLDGDRVSRAVGGVSSPADLGWDAKRRRVAVPQLLEGRVAIWELPQ